MTADLGVHGSSVTLPGGFRDVGFGSQDSCCLFAALCSVVVRRLVFCFRGVGSGRLSVLKLSALRRLLHWTPAELCCCCTT